MTTLSMANAVALQVKLETARELITTHFKLKSFKQDDLARATLLRARALINEYLEAT